MLNRATRLGVAKLCSGPREPVGSQTDFSVSQGNFQVTVGCYVRNPVSRRLLAVMGRRKAMTSSQSCGCMMKYHSGGA
jgi:hypothetical protein